MKAIEWLDDRLRLIDQTTLPSGLASIECRAPEDVAEAIVNMRVRGAPAIGIAAGYGMALAAARSGAKDVPDLMRDLNAAAQMLRRTRPTAVQLFWATDEALKAAREAADVIDATRRVLDAAHRLRERERRANLALARHGAELIPIVANILTHCNTGELATAGYGTALGIVRTAHAQGKRIHVWVDETRPALQGARLAAWELLKEGIPHTVIVDSAAASLMRRGKVDVVVVGADRIAANGDTANKVGTYGLAVIARAHGVPFYVAAPTSTIDPRLPNGDAIPIEERSPDEIRRIGNMRIAPDGSPALNLAFDVTPHDLISAIVTELGVIRSPYDHRLTSMVRDALQAV